MFTWDMARPRPFPLAACGTLGKFTARDPERLTAKKKSRVAKILPAGDLRQRVHFRKAERAAR
jgi:hypothetical protein